MSTNVVPMCAVYKNPVLKDRNSKSTGKSTGSKGFPAFAETDLCTQNSFRLLFTYDEKVNEKSIRRAFALTGCTTKTKERWAQTTRSGRRKMSHKVENQRVDDSFVILMKTY